MIGVIEALDPLSCLGETKLPRIDLLPAGDDAGNRPETHADARRAGIDKARKRVGEHIRIELVGLAVDIEISAREAGRQQRGAEAGSGGEELVDKTVLRAPKGARIEPRCGEEIHRIFGAAMR